LNPAFILLDEPFSGIDPLAVLDIQKIITDLSRARIGILITDHNVPETLAVADRAYILNSGRILCAGTPNELSTDAEVRRIYLGNNFRLN
jgi:lipopolysaccharide export system ATP-binding protein